MKKILAIILLMIPIGFLVVIPIYIGIVKHDWTDTITLCIGTCLATSFNVGIRLLE